MQDSSTSAWPLAFALVYFTFFLDNVLLTVLVPIIPDWVRGESLALWAEHESGAAPLARVLNATVDRVPTYSGVGGSQAAVGAVLSVKAVAQLAGAGPAAAAVARLGAARVLRAGTSLLLLAALVFTWCGHGGGAWAAWGAGVGRAAQGGGAALAGVAGLALAAAAVPPRRRDAAIAALLGAVALGVLVGYPLGGVTYAVWSREAPFLLVAGALLLDLGLQCVVLRREEFNRVSCGPRGCGGVAWVVRGARGAAGACAGAVLLTTCVMAALEPCLPLWIMDKFHPQRWVSGWVFVPDSAGYLVAASTLGTVARRYGAERVALIGQLAVACAALTVPLARSVWQLAGPHVVLGAGLGALDAALQPALLARGPAPQRAALTQGAAAAAYALGPGAGGALAAAAGFDTAMRTLGVLNILYAAYLYRALAADPISVQWGAKPLDEDVTAADDGAVEGDGRDRRDDEKPRAQYHTFQ